ncbi:MAG: hypothetical protein K0Q79_320 [Flavipsychrobacter sp.]|jgi:hypothetical protein|nr:hypothetical protein [Flavipsychrobacter sp.]
MDFACFAYPLRLCVKISMPVFYGSFSINTGIFNQIQGQGAIDYQ